MLHLRAYVYIIYYVRLQQSSVPMSDIPTVRVYGINHKWNLSGGDVIRRDSTIAAAQSLIRRLQGPKEFT